MDFLDNALNKAKEAIDVVSKKTGEFVTLEKQKFDVSSIKSKLEKDYAKLGKYYFELLKNSAETPEEVKQMVESINAKIAEIDKLNVEIETAKNKKICAACKASIPQSAVFCPSCGEKLVFDSSEE